MSLPAISEEHSAQAEYRFSHLQQLEAESIYIFREVESEFENPVMLYSIGKDSSVLLHLAKKAFYPGKIPFPLLHVDTTWKFQEMIEFRNRIAKEYGLDLLVYTNEEYRDEVTPFTHDSKTYTDIMKTEALKQALDQYGFDAAFGGARRDEEKSRAKERIFSVRDSKHQWDPKNQRPELWQLFNSNIRSDEEVRIFPLSNWTELDVWHYIHQQQIEIVPLYFSKSRPVVRRNDTWIMIDDERMQLATDEQPVHKDVRFRTLGCYPLSGAIESKAQTVPEIIQEILQTGYSERQGRLIDHGTTAAMERMRKEGYF